MFSNSNISIANLADIPFIVDLLNSTYRGEASKKGWTTEADLIAGNTRTTSEILKTVMEKPGSVFLKYTNEHNEIIACVNLQKHGQKLYLGMFSVSPELQGGGVGKIMLTAANEYAQNQYCISIYMQVISVRTELIDWYMRHGYKKTGEVIPFEEDGYSGIHLQKLEFLILEKTL